MAPLNDITPEAIKEAASLARTKYRDRAELKHNSALNYITRRLGFREGFAGYQQSGYAQLREFMDRHALRSRADLIRPRSRMPFIKLAPRNLSDRLFSLENGMPHRVFTGYNIDWFGVNDRHFRDNIWEDHPQYVLLTLPYGLVMEAVARGNELSPAAGNEVLEAAVAACQMSITGCANLLGDILFSSNEPDLTKFSFVPKMYCPGDLTPDDYQKHVARVHDVAKFLRVWAAKQDKGWVRVLPFNDRLIFLAGEDGEYDFLFSGLRDELFNHNPHAPYLKNGDIPKSNDSYHFNRWIYFEYKGWLEREEHLAEITYYARGGVPKQHPGRESLLKKHLELKGEYKPLCEATPPTSGFIPVAIGNRLLCVSNLVTMEHFHEFMRCNSHYADYSRALADVDPWEPPNNSADQTDPAVVTWYDAHAYTAWISRSTGLPVRLLTEEEYIQVSSTSSNLEFPADVDFGEWLNEFAAAINTATKESLCYPGFNATKGLFCARSNGSYQKKRVGFRLCYLGEAFPNQGVMSRKD